ncbi:helix-turn-helix domain-containing protein [Parapedobacter tibetensis]|uniref:helix-turn-helix domain-containing protein n=1 Tax=Parapedobacter tibetensis TaxID=2972951 RepID=UPI00214DD9DB|nr:helix-turn-helix transcriptional regulator [Parapedobacter tibetensis]
MTALGEILAKRSVNKSMVARRTGLSKARMNELTLNHSSKLRADELYLIAKAIDMDPCALLNQLYGQLVLVQAEED